MLLDLHYPPRVERVHAPIVLDTADPGGETQDACGDADLGAPNMRCRQAEDLVKEKEGEPGEEGAELQSPWKCFDCSRTRTNHVRTIMWTEA